MFSQIDNTNSFTEIMKNIESFNIYKNGTKQKINKNNKNFELITEKLAEIFSQARIMPAFGVSLHNDTIQALQNNIWLEINFNTEQTLNDLPFSSLLFKLEKTYGINLIRKYNNSYSGRCIYLDFMQQMDLTNIIPKALYSN